MQAAIWEFCHKPSSSRNLWNFTTQWKVGNLKQYLLKGQRSLYHLRCAKTSGALWNIFLPLRTHLSSSEQLIVQVYSSVSANYQQIGRALYLLLFLLNRLFSYLCQAIFLRKLNVWDCSQLVFACIKHEFVKRGRPSVHGNFFHELVDTMLSLGANALSWVAVLLRDVQLSCGPDWFPQIIPQWMAKNTRRH